MIRRSFLCIALFVAACNGGQDSVLESTPRQSSVAAVPEKNIYALANGCWGLATAPQQQAIIKEGDGWFADGAEKPMPFFFKATDLGSYLLQDTDSQFLGVSDPTDELLNSAGAFVGHVGSLINVLGATVARMDGGRTPVGGTVRHAGSDIQRDGQALGNVQLMPALAVGSAPTDLAIWELVAVGQGRYKFIHQITGLRLAASESGVLTLMEPSAADGNDVFQVLAAQGCTPFPEIDTNTVVHGTPKRLNDDGTVFGWVDAHNHITGSEYLGGRVTYGFPFHKLGVTQALGNCEAHHGPSGAVSPLNYLFSTGPHDTVGWPSFNDWPGPGELLHHQTYYRWLERAFLSGQKLMVNHFVENGGLCNLHAPINRNDCDEMASIRHQHQVLLKLQDYIDAQHGGPGEGWFRIVTDSVQARAVIADGKMAVIMGAEVGKILGCGEKADQPDCSIPEIQSSLAELHQLGLRTIFPIHRQDNAFGGARVGGTDPVNAFVSSGTITNSLHTYRLEACAEDGDQAGQPQPGLLEELANILSYYSGSAGGPAMPIGAGDARYCNARGLTGHGEYLIAEMMRNNWIIEIDHTGARVRDRILELAAQHQYPVVSAHSWTDVEALPRIFDVKGAVSRYSCNAECYTEGIQSRYLPAVNPDTYLGIGFGSDANGLGALPGPRESASETPLQYPFMSYDGQVEFFQQQSGDRVFNLNTDGVAHYGLYADLAADIQYNGGPDKEQAIATLFKSAEAYLQMWERAEGRRQ